MKVGIVGDALSLQIKKAADKGFVQSPGAVSAFGEKGTECFRTMMVRQ